MNLISPTVPPYRRGSERPAHGRFSKYFTLLSSRVLSRMISAARQPSSFWILEGICRCRSVDQWPGRSSDGSRGRLVGGDLLPRVPADPTQVASRLNAVKIARARCGRRCRRFRRRALASTTSVQRSGVIFVDVKPIADVLTVAVNRQRAPPARPLTDDVRNELSGKSDYGRNHSNNQ